MLVALKDVDLEFSEVEVYNSVFAGDENIKKASINLLSAIFYAVECVIGFFVKKTCKLMQTLRYLSMRGC